LNTDVFGLINVKGDNDYYRFSITNQGSVTISLTSLPADYQLSLLDGSGRLLLTSGNTGTTNETISTNLSAGTFYVRVFPRNNGAFNANSCYTLRVQTGTASRMAVENVGPVNNGLNVSPNPATSRARLSFTVPESGNATLLIIDQTGSVVSRKQILVNAGANNSELEIGNLANGSYFIKLQAGATVQMTRLVIAK
jgi:hypothetical protein